MLRDGGAGAGVSMRRGGAGPTRFAVVWCPQWPIAAVLLRRAAASPDGRGAACAGTAAPLAVLDGRRRVMACSVAAAAAGVRVGQRRREAQSRCPDLDVVEARDLDTVPVGRLFERVVAVIAEYVAAVEVSEPGTCWFDVRGPARVHGGEQALAALLTDRVTTALGPVLTHCGPLGVGIAEGRLAARVAARVAARTGRPHHVAPGQSAAFLAGQPLTALIDVDGVTAREIGLLQRLGFTRLGDLAVLDGHDWVDRFGVLGAQIRSAVVGADDRTLDARAAPDDMTVQDVFDPPVEHADAVAFAARALAERLVTALADRGEVCTVVEVTLDTDPPGRVPWTRRWSVAAGIRVPEILDRVRWQAEGGIPDSGAPDAGGRRAVTTADPVHDPGGSCPDRRMTIVGIRIAPVEIRPDRRTGEGFWGERNALDDRVQRAVARVRALVGDEQVVMADLRGGRHPDAVAVWVPTVERGARGAAAAATARVGGTDPRARDAPWPGRLPVPSPAVVYRAPRPVEVFDAAARPVTVSGRGEVSGIPATICDAGEVGAIRDWGGPWLVDERWWDPRRHRRIARFQFVVDGGAALLAAVEDHRWWIVGVYR